MTAYHGNANLHDKIGLVMLICCFIIVFILIGKAMDILLDDVIHPILSEYFPERFPPEPEFEEWPDENQKVGD